MAQQQKEKVYRGTVRWFDPQKGFGFVTAEGLKNDVFVHFSGINMEGYKKLDDNQEVEFQIQSTDRGPMAVQVTPL